MSRIKHELYLGDPYDPKVFSLEETNIFVDEWGTEYRDHDRTNFVVEVYGINDLDPNEHTHWAGLEPTYFATYGEALACFAEQLQEQAQFETEHPSIR